MNTELFIAKRIVFDKENQKSISQNIVKIAIAGIALGLVVMIFSIAIVTGFKNEIRKKVTGYGSHILITNYDTNSSYETQPIEKKQDFYPDIEQIEGIKHIQIFATKLGIIKTKTNIQGAVLKGIGSDFDWTFFNSNIIKGKNFVVNNGKKSNDIIISSYLADLLDLDVGNDLFMYFIQQPPRSRKFNISGIYETSLEDIDKKVVLVDIAHIQKLNNWSKNQISGFEILIDDYDDLDKMKDKVFSIAGYKINEDGSALKIQHIKQIYPELFDWLALSDTNVWVIIIITIIVSVFNMISGLLILILERTKMIGILKALGATNWSIMKTFLYNAAFLTGKGLLWGNIIGIGLCLLQKYLKIVKLDPESYYIATVPINIDVVHLLLLNAGTLLIIIIALIVPSLIIARIKPVKAINFN